MPKHKLYITIYFLLICSFCLGQQYTNYTIKDGLPSNLVYRITQDQKGFIWIITDKGISKFDGYSFKNFTIKEGLPTNDIWNIRITPDQKVWYFSQSDALGYIKNDSVFSFKTSGGKVLKPIRIHQFGNSIWLKEVKYRHEFKENIWQEVTMDIADSKLLNREINSLLNYETKIRLKNPNGDIVFESKSNYLDQVINYQLNDSLYVLRNSNFHEIINLNTLTSKHIIYKEEENFPKKLLNPRFHLVNDKIQLTGNDELFILNNQLNQSERYQIPKTLKSHFSFKDKEGWIWVATFTSGIYKLPKNYNRISQLFKGKRIATINNIENTMYIGVIGEGIYKIINNKPELHIPYANYIYEINKIDNRIFYVLEHDVYIEENKSLKRIKRINNLNLGKHFLEYKNNIISEGFLTIFSSNKKFRGATKLYDDKSYAGIFVKNDTLFSTDNKRLVYFNNTLQGFNYYKNIELTTRYLTNITHKNKTYIALESKGLFSFENGKLIQLIKNDNASIRKIEIENEASIWCVADNILTNYKRNSDGNYIKHNYPEINGLLVNNLKNLAIKGNLLYLGTEEGIIIISTNDILEASNFSTYLKSVEVNGKKNLGDKLNIKYNKNLSLNISFSAINFSNASQTNFEYQLNPIHNSWVKTTTGEINLINLEPGDYTLKMKVFKNKNGNIKDLPIVIKPLWWQTYWAKFLIVLIGIIAVALVSRFLAKRSEFKKNKKILEAKQVSELQLKALRSQMNPHFVFNSLAAIQYYININNKKASEQYLIKFSLLIRQFFEFSKETEINITEEIKLLKNYLDIEKLRFKDMFEYEFYIDTRIDKEETKLPTMLLQPIVENAINHGVFNKINNGKININFIFLKRKSIRVEIKDNGVGKEKTKNLINNKIKSSNVLKDRLNFLNKSGKWKIKHLEEELNPELDDKGNKSIFIITKT